MGRDHSSPSIPPSPICPKVYYLMNPLDASSHYYKNNLLKSFIYSYWENIRLLKVPVHYTEKIYLLIYYENVMNILYLPIHPILHGRVSK
jgi:hypothetical protein